MKVSISTYHGPEGEDACALTIEARRSRMSCREFRDPICESNPTCEPLIPYVGSPLDAQPWPNQFTKELRVFAQALRDFDDGSKDEASFHLFSGEVTSYTSVKLSLAPHAVDGRVLLNAVEESLYVDYCDDGIRWFRHHQECVQWEFDLELADLNRMGERLLDSSEKEVFDFTFEFATS